MAKRPIQLDDPVEMLSPDGSTRPMSPAEIEEHKRDVRLAETLLHGVRRDGPNGFPVREFLSRNTTPTEDEARAALARLLLRGTAPHLLLLGVASLFMPDAFRGPSPWSLFSPGERRVVFRNRSKGHSNHARDGEILERIYILRQAGKTYEEACSQVAEAAGIEVRQVKRIYASDPFMKIAFKRRRSRSS
jgi:hypothetical protein